MSAKVLQRLNLLAICLLGGVLASVLIAQVLPSVHPHSQPKTGREYDDWPWPQTLQVYPSHPGDPVKLVRITKGAKEIVPGRYRMPVIVSPNVGDPRPLDDWLGEVSFVLQNQGSRNIVSVGIAVVFPARRTDIDCPHLTGEQLTNDGWCDAHPHWCDGGCPVLIYKTLHWGRIPKNTAAGLEARYRAESRILSVELPIGAPLQGNGQLLIAPSEAIPLSPTSRFDGMLVSTDPTHGVPNILNGILHSEGIDEARDAEPCVDRAGSKTGCAFAEVSKFNIGVDVVYFEDGTIWGNYGYGYALPNADGIFTRTEARDLPGAVSPGSTPK